jgi:hypothetical protein
MLRSFMCWWAAFSPWLRFGVVGLFFLVAAVLLLFGYVWYWGWFVGTVLLLFAFPSKAERRGYHDF